MLNFVSTEGGGGGGGWGGGGGGIRHTFLRHFHYRVGVGLPSVHLTDLCGENLKEKNFLMVYKCYSEGLLIRAGICPTQKGLLIRK